MERRQRGPLSLITASILSLFAISAAADWLVLTDGTAIETRGAWEEQGRLIVFTLPDGTLSSMAAAELDLEASRERTAEASRPEPPPVESPEPPARATVVITDADVRRATPPPPPR